MEINALMKGLEEAQKRGFEKGIEYMEQRILDACKKGTPLEIRGEAFFLKGAINNLYDIFDDLEKK